MSSTMETETIHYTLDNKQTFPFKLYLVVLHETLHVIYDFQFLKLKQYISDQLSARGHFCLISTAYLTVCPTLGLTGHKTFPSLSLY